MNDEAKRIYAARGYNDILTKHGIPKTSLKRLIYTRLTQIFGAERCWICQQPASPIHKLSVDHHRATGQLRGLLCEKCNLAIGLLDEDLDRFVRAATYLRVNISLVDQILAGVALELRQVVEQVRHHLPTHLEQRAKAFTSALGLRS